MNDRRLWSTTPKLLSEFVGMLMNAGLPAVPVKELQRILREKRCYPARDFAQYCVPEPPDVFFTYHSAQNFVEIQQIAWQAVGYAMRELQNSQLAIDLNELQPMTHDGVRIWVDFMFIDQSARDLREELLALPELMKTATAHFVLGSQPLTRAWCCYELALFNQHLAAEDAQPAREEFAASIPRLRSYIAPTRSFYAGWDLTETSEPEDKRFIAERIAATFPGGFDGFHRVIAEANTVAILSFTEGSTFTSPAADAHLRLAAQAWYARWMSAGQPGPS